MSPQKTELESIYHGEAIFWCRDAQLPSPRQLQRAVAARHAGVLLWERVLDEAEKARAVTWLQSALPGARVEGIAPFGACDRVRFRRLLAREEIIRHAAELCEAARAFAGLARVLSQQLAAKIGISATELSLCGQYLPPGKFIAQTGVLHPDWNYFFHGFECGFRHRQSGQHLDVIFGFRDEFGVLSAWFWHGFLKTTPRFAALSRWLALGAFDLQTAMDVALAAGWFVEIENSPDFVCHVPGRRGCIVAP